ncbi:1,2-phenylacetyl-CoA epoxidase subunit PaaD [Leekyejoonella antrihumi]|uniref:1,2-phenylacetyl-CoA epoxidase subunit PaaD n=1 Tax=Leekyejoonella antrihumi TaxID=1660198 RepID=UPI00319E4D6D
MATKRAVVERIRAVPDPEIPVLSIDDLGIVRGLVVDEAQRRVHVTITPTYSGCPAMKSIEQGIQHAARQAGYTAEVETRLTPAWTTDWMSESGKLALERFGIAPPSTTSSPSGPVAVSLGRRVVTCPVCGSSDTEELSHFGATACKALRRCRSCREPFEEFKSL